MVVVAEAAVVCGCGSLMGEVNFYLWLVERLVSSHSRQKLFIVRRRLVGYLSTAALRQPKR